MRLVEDAKTEELCCPLSRGIDTETRSCVGSGCMAWQWENLGHVGGIAKSGFCGMVATPGESKHQKETIYY